jgi:threonine synthase
MFPSPALEELLRVKRVFVKDEGRNCSGSLKDRASANVVAHAKLNGIRRVATASTGNAAAALAASCAAAGIECLVFVPQLCPEPKLTQLLMYGARVYRVRGNYERALETCAAVCKKHGIVDRTTAVNPLTILGKKTAMLEALQREDFDAAFVSVGDGNILSSLHAAITDYQGIMGRQFNTKLIGVQAKGSSMCASASDAFSSLSDLACAWGEGQVKSVKSDTIADSLSADLPRDLFRAVRAVRETHGSFEVVEDEQIQKAHVTLARCGIFVEPSCAATLAGALQYRKERCEKDVLDETWLLMMTGTGLKDISGAAASVKRFGGGGVAVTDIDAGDVDAVIF